MKILVLILIFMLFSACSEQSTSVSDEKVEIKFESRQIPGCVQDLPKNGEPYDSCFTYSFDETLKVDLCLTSCCCPDHDRYSSSFILIEDTIQVTVLDTMPNLCYCLCNYIFHSEVTGLIEDEYIFKCIYMDIVFYQEKVE